MLFYVGRSVFCQAKRSKQNPAIGCFLANNVTPKAENKRRQAAAAVLDTHMKSLGQRIQEARGSVSRAEFCKRIGITSSTLRNYEKGTALPNADVLGKLCAACALDADWLLLGKPPTPDEPEEAPNKTPSTFALAEEQPEELAFEPAPPDQTANPAHFGHAALCIRCDMWAELKKEMEAIRNLNERMARMDRASETVRLKNERLDAENRALREQILSLERENARLLATRNTSGKPKKHTGHVDRITLVSPPRLQESSDMPPEPFPGDV